MKRREEKMKKKYRKGTEKQQLRIIENIRNRLE